MHKGETLGAVFELMNTGRAASGPRVLGLWETVPGATSGGIAFDPAASSADAAAPLWRLRLPADLDLATRQLALSHANLEASRKALESIPDRLNALVQAQKSGSSFDISSVATTLSEPEADLLLSLGMFRDYSPTVSFGLGDKLTAGWEHTVQQLQACVDQALQSIAHYVWVETYIEAQFVGRTAVNWTGDVETIWRDGVLPAQATLHQNSLALAVESRNTLIRTLVAAIQGAAELCLLLAVPGGAVLALPAVWRFVNQVLADIGDPLPSEKDRL